MNRKILTIAAHEYVTNVRRKEFILITLGLPLLILVAGGIGALGAGAAMRQLMKGSSRVVGIVDHSGAVTIPPDSARGTGYKLTEYKAEDAGRGDVKRGTLAALIVLDKEYLTAGTVRVYRKGGGIFSKEDMLPVGPILTRILLVNSTADKARIDRAVQPVGPGGALSYVLEKDRFVPFNSAKMAAKFIVPYIFTILLITSIFISSSYLLRGIADEKENRIIEVILSSVTTDDLLAGKLIGLAGVGLTQVGIWVSLGAVPAILSWSQFIHLSAGALAAIVLFFGLGFGLYATLMAGLGALGTSYRETQQISGMVSILAFIPFMLLTIILELPNGIVARVLSYIPFTAPTTMVLRLTAADVPATDIAISALCIAVGIWLVLKIASRLFRFGILIYGKRPSFGETLRWLRESTAV